MVKKLNYSKMTKRELYGVYEKKTRKASPRVQSINYTEKSFTRCPKSDCIRMAKKAHVTTHGDIAIY
jgi:hypothetical protein